MAGFSITIDAKDAQFLAQELASMPQKIPQAIASAFNKTIAKVKTSIARGIVDATTLKYGRVIDGTFTRKATKTNLYAGVSFKGRQIGAVNFKTSKIRNRGFKVTMMKGDKPIHFKHAFVATGKSGNTQMFNRRKLGSRIAARLPLDTIYGPSLGTIYRKHPKIEQAANELANATIRQELESQVNRFLGRKKK
jgi:hypothetical protein